MGLIMKWIDTPSKGVRYREHPNRKHGKVRKDKYYAIRYQKNGKRKEEGLGWESDGWTLDKAISELIRLKEAAQKGEGPARMAEKRFLEYKRKESEQVEQKRIEKENITFAKFMAENYLPQCERDKKPKTYDTEETLYRIHLAGTIGPLPLQQDCSIAP